NAFGGLIGLDIDFSSNSSSSVLTVTTTAAADTVLLAPGEVTFGGLFITQLITFNIPNVTVYGSAEDTAVLVGTAGVADTFTVTPTQVTVHGFTVIGFGTVTALGQGVNSGDGVIVDDSTATAPVTYDLDNQSVHRSGLATIGYAGVTFLALV